MLPTLLDERDHGLLTSVLSFLQGLVTADSARRAALGAHGARRAQPRLTRAPRSFRGCVPKVMRLLDRLVRTQDVPADYMYYSLPSPWMQVCTRRHSCRRRQRVTRPSVCAIRRR